MKYFILIYSVVMLQFNCTNKRAIDQQVLDGDKPSAVKIINQRPDTCDLEIIKEIKSNIDNLTDVQVLLFLKSFNDQCKNDATYFPAANFHLFLLIQHQPELTVKVLEENDQIDLEFISFNLRNPINEEVDIHSTIQALEGISYKSSAKDFLLEALKR